MADAPAVTWEVVGGVLVVTLPSAEAGAIGLVDRVTAEGGALGGALELAASLSAMSRPALGAVIRSVDAAFDLPLDEGFRVEAAQVEDLFEHGEGARASPRSWRSAPPKFGD